MRKALFPIISTLSICFLFSGCWIKDVLEDLEDYESGVAEVDRALLYGAWQIDKAKFAADATMTAWDYSNTYMTFKENGIYEGEGYYGDVKGIYTIQGNVITVLIDNVNYVSYKVLAQSDESLTLRAAFTTTTTKVWMECKKAEYLEVPPEALTQEASFVNEENVKKYYDYYYNRLSSYVQKQLEVEQLIVDNNRNQLTPESKTIFDLWSAGYTLNHQTNEFISVLSQIDGSSINYDKRPYIANAKAVRAFVLYNMNMLWGGIPIVTLEMTTEELEQIARSSEADVYNYIYNEVKDYTDLMGKNQDYGNKVMGERAVNTLLLELALSVRNTDLSAGIVEKYKNATDEDYFVLHYSPDNVTAQATDYLIYSQKKFTLLSQEAINQTEGLVDSWTTQFKYGYGYWAALKRLGVAKDITHCADYQLLLPFPTKVVMSAKNIVQNPGY